MKLKKGMTEEKFNQVCEKKGINEKDIRRFINTIDAFSIYSKPPRNQDVRNYTGLSGTQVEFLADALGLKVQKG